MFAGAMFNFTPLGRLYPLDVIWLLTISWLISYLGGRNGCPEM